MKTEFFAIKDIAKISSTLDFINTAGTAYRVWYNSDNF